VLLHVFAHVDARHGAVVVEEELGERFAQFRLADTGGAEEEEAADGAVLILDARTGTAHRIADGGDGVFLADDAAT
jgi:hypothetical protein